MGRVSLIIKDNVYIEEEANYYKISKKLFSFKPRVGMKVKVLKKSDGTILKIIMIKENKKLLRKTTSGLFIRITRLYSLLFGLTIITLLSEDIHAGKDYLPLILFSSLLLIIFSIINMVIKSRKSNRIYLIFTTIFYLLLFIIGGYLLFNANFYSGSTLISVSIVPVILNVLAFVFEKKTDISTTTPFASFINK